MPDTTNLFLVSGVVERLGGTPELKKLGGLYRAQPALALLFLVPAMSLVESSMARLDALRWRAHRSYFGVNDS